MLSFRYHRNGLSQLFSVYLPLIAFCAENAAILVSYVAQPNGFTVYSNLYWFIRPRPYNTELIAINWA